MNPLWRWKFIMALMFLVVGRMGLPVLGNPNQADIMVVPPEQWEMAENLEKTPSSRFLPSDIQLKPKSSFKNPQTQDFLHVFEYEPQTPGDLELQVFKIETLYMDSCFFLKHRSFQIDAMDPSLEANPRHRMLPVCWSEEANSWSWSLMDFVKSKDENSLFILEFQPSEQKLDGETFAQLEEALNTRTGLCRPQNVKKCYERIRAPERTIQVQEAQFSKQHPEHYLLAQSKSEQADSLISECKNLQDSEDLLERIHKFALSRPDCSVEFNSRRISYICKPEKAKAIAYRFFEDQKSCQDWRVENILIEDESPSDIMAEAAPSEAN